MLTMGQKPLCPCCAKNCESIGIGMWTKTEF